MSTTPRVAVIIVSYNGLAVIQKCLASVVQTRWDHLQIIFVDNQSTDGSIEWVVETFPEIQVIQHPENWLFSRANNEVIREIDTDYVVLLNNDVAVSDDWLHSLVDYAEQYPKVGALQPKVLQFQRRDHFEYAGACGGFIDQLGYPFARGRVFSHTEKDTGQYDEPRHVDWASGAAMLLRSSALRDVGLLDEHFGLHMEEIDLCWRLRRAGYDIAVVPCSKVYHIGGATLPRNSSLKLYYNIRNSILMLYKNLSVGHFRRVFFQRIIMDHCIACAWFFSGRWKLTASVIRGYLDAHKLRHHYHPPLTTTASPSYSGRILIDYLFFRRRNFSDLHEEKFCRRP